MEKIAEFISSLVRPIIAIMFSVGILYGFISSGITGESFLTIAGTVLAFYFGTKSSEAKVVTDRRNNNPPVNVEGDVNVNPLITEPKK